MGKFIFSGVVLLVLPGWTCALNADEAQSYSLLAKPSTESSSLSGHLSYLGNADPPSDSVLSLQNSSLGIPELNQEQSPFMQNGKVELIKDTQMQIRPNGVNLKLQY